MNRSAALAVVAALLAVSCRRRSEGSPAPRAAAPDQIIGQFTMDSYARGGREWSLEAPKAYVYEPESRVEVDHPRILFFGKPRVRGGNPPPGAVVEAGRGRFHTGDRDIRAWDGVVIVSTDGARLESPWMEYRSDEDLVVSTAPVTVTRGASVVRGVGWEAKPDLSRVVVRRQTVEWVEPPK